MRNLLTFLFSLLIIHFSPAQRITEKNRMTVIEMITPPNGIHLYDNWFIDETEIANIHYLEYLYYLAKDSTEEFYNSQLPDPDAWELKLQPKDSVDRFLKKYFKYPGFRYSPVIGVSYEQAMNYCIWRGKSVTSKYKECSLDKECARKYPHINEFDIVIEYRLPTKAEWEYAAGLSHLKELPYGTKRPTGRHYKLKRSTCDCTDCLDENKRDTWPGEIRRVEFNVVDDYYLNDYAHTLICIDKKIPAPKYIYEFPENVNRIYGMIGNVAEMVLEKGIAKGGSFRHKLSEFDLTTDFKYAEANEWLGFRCMAVVHLRKK